MGQFDAVSMNSVLVWHTLCRRCDLIAGSGIVAWLDGLQIALFYLPSEREGDRIFALDNRDPRSGANVIGRGLVCSLGGKLAVAAPLYKQHFGLEDGVCLESPAQRLRSWPARFRGDSVEVGIGD